MQYQHHISRRHALRNMACGFGGLAMGAMAHREAMAAGNPLSPKMLHHSPKAKRVEFRVPDPSSNPYLAFSALVMAGLDGIKNKIEPIAPVDKDLYELPPDELANIPTVPDSLTGSLDALEEDNEFLQAGGVFPADLIETWIDYKRTNEVDPIRLRPHPHEFEMYYDI